MRILILALLLSGCEALYDKSESLADKAKLICSNMDTQDAQDFCYRGYAFQRLYSPKDRVEVCKLISSHQIQQQCFIIVSEH